MNGKSNSDNEDWENKKSDIRQQTCLFVCLLDCLFELRTQKMQFTYECRFAFIRL